MAILDEKNCMILNLLQEDCRMSLTDMARRVNLSVDSVRKRLKKLEEQIYFYPKVQIRPRMLGFPNIVDVKIKLRDYDDKKLKQFIDYTVSHPRIAEVFSLSGEWDFTLVIISKDHEDLGEITDEIRNKFGAIITEWSESLTKKAYKFEAYDVLKLKGHQ
ncbi:Lrp/AsnC family transcriptional regulator [Candidatus Woesearchaeota archaeon]|jgi:Lrp/AsnC family transcriptional regulator|nr:Lrp/AsnC family transcriptional regulator [Candidatus Woesearchaeota archaeon]MBT3538434.1 Lrp/AsnC family transcriptional regulator [Candidatus Woesearchaeota archaeon]MBT4696997.1 Lrp/AsnC family transcriptional regulator [Candidatus Woesearchaeota archaeon]MBT7106110.1 Lrp/AsnC family transcriptional regulator [Candidatus Woesearchaeota archaeon]MBT7930992.1 Lrp/AsnC family transcriptional regulator [Candidatus Woesearchaeota archaeon]